MNAAGIDIGSAEHFVAVPEDRDEQPVKSFKCFTPDLHSMAVWLKECGIETIAMESTGVYWVPIYKVLESYGFEVKLVDARHVKNVPGRKSDVCDCRWIQELHTYGLLTGAFIPDMEISTLRSYWRHRSNLVESCSRQTLLMQKSLDLMSLHLHKVISDITGKTGMAIIRAIAAGERDPKKLAQLKDRRIKAEKNEIEKALSGHYQEAHLLALQQSLETYDFLQVQIKACDHKTRAFLKTLESKCDPDELGPPPKNRRRRKNQPDFDLASELHRICGVDLTQIDGLNAMTVYTIITEIGHDMSPFKSAKHLASYLGLCPGNKKTGGKVKQTKSKKIKNRAAQAFRLGAQSLHRSQTALGAFYRRMRYRLGAAKAITATAHKLCRIFYRLLKNGEQYVSAGMEEYQKQYEERVRKNLLDRAKKLGLQVVDKETGEVLA